MARKFEVREGVPKQDPQVQIISGIKTYVFGVDQIDSSKPVVLAVLCHGRTQDHTTADVLANEILHKLPNVVCATFDLPNHGARTVYELANQDWAVGNPNHAQDMSGCMELGASEVELISRYLPSYFPELEKVAASGDLLRVVSGISLGGHICWRTAIGPQGPLGKNIYTGIAPLIGCPKLANLMEDRYAASSSSDALLPLSVIQNLEDFNKTSKLKDYSSFRILALCGGEDRLVPASYTESWARGNNNELQVIDVQKGVGHWISPEMIDKLIAWIDDIYKKHKHNVYEEIPDTEIPDAKKLPTSRPLDEDN